VLPRWLFPRSRGRRSRPFWARQSPGRTI